jgi:pimeloyl-ACP methyl ester carboxylesterase/predicted glycosyltransferase
VGRSDTETPARVPDREGVIERDGVRVWWGSYGSESRPAVLLLPSWSIVHSAQWKAQIPYLARRFHVIAFDGRGNGLSDRPEHAAAYRPSEFVADAVAVLDAAGAESAVVAGLSMGGHWALVLAAAHPRRVLGAVAVSPTIPALAPPGSAPQFNAKLEAYEGWGKYNRHYWRTDYRAFLEFFFSTMFVEPHSTKHLEDGVAWGLDTDGETLIRTIDGALLELGDPESVAATLGGVSRPAMVIHGTADEISAVEVGRRAAELTAGELVVLDGAGHAPTLRDPVKVNLLLRDFAERAVGTQPRSRVWKRAAARPKRALFVCSPIGLGHAWRDVAIADELRRQVPGIEVEWLAQEPVTAVLRERGESIHPASAELASEAEHIDREAGEHDLHAFQALRRMDAIFCANFMLFHDVVSEEQFDVWVGDEAWEVDHFLHENPELKTAPYAWLTDFVGYLPMGEQEIPLTADYNAEMIEHVERYPGVRDVSIFIGDPEDIVPQAFGPDLPGIREWTERHYRFAGYAGAALSPSAGGAGPLCVVSVGGSGVGTSLLRRVIEALPLARERVPGLRMLAVTGPRIDPASLPHADGLELRGYVHELWREFAACDFAVVQGGLSTTMELVAAGTPFVSLPLASHFEQRFHVRHRLDRYGARDWLEYEDATPERIADAIADGIGSEPRYRPVDPGGAARAARCISELI